MEKSNAEPAAKRVQGGEICTGRPRERTLRSCKRKTEKVSMGADIRA